MGENSKGFTVASVSQEDQTMMISSIQQADGAVRIVITPFKTNEAKWIVKFRKAQKF